MKSPLDWFRFRRRSREPQPEPPAKRERLDRGLREPPAIRKRTLRLSVGLDFGTSSTKVAYAILGEPGRPVRPIVFDHDLPCYPPFCYPNVGAIHKGEILWGRQAAELLHGESWEWGIRRLKVLVAGAEDPRFLDEEHKLHHDQYIESRGLDPNRHSPAVLMAASLAEQLSFVRHRLNSELNDRIDDAVFNICVPIEQVEQNSVLRRYLRILNAAQGVLRPDGLLELSGRDLVSYMTDQIKRERAVESPDGRLFPVPESVAQVACYVNSLAVERGVHAIVDVGAGTTDLSIFRVAETDRGGRRCYWYAARNLPSGVAAVETAVAIHFFAHSSQVLTEDDLARFIRLRNNEQELRDFVTGQLSQLRIDVNKTWSGAYGHLKKQSEWEGRPIFLAGGGARLPGIEEFFGTPWVETFRRHPTQKLPAPHNYSASNGVAPFGRMSVAYGLSFPKPELTEYVLPGNVGDHTPKPTIIERDLDGDDKPRPKPGWV